MTRCWPFPKPDVVCLSLAILFTLSFTAFENPLHALTVSVGEPSSGRLMGSVKFPSPLAGYKLRNENASYTTPEVVGALLSALESFNEMYPDSCDVLFGDFSDEGGGPMEGHESHQNGRDVDIGLFARGNVPLSHFAPMDSKTLDIPKTWRLVRGLLDTERVQNIFLDTSIQALLYRHALSEGFDPAYLSKVFKDAGREGEKEGVILHVPGHCDHMHVRFFAPWSTLAGKLKKIDPRNRALIEVAQQSCLPRGAGYHFAAKSGKTLKQMAKDPRGRSRGLPEFNGLSVLMPGPNSGSARSSFKTLG